MSARPRVLVKEKIAESGVELLREHFDVDLRTDMDQEELAAEIGAYDGIVIRSATQLDAALIERASRLRVIGRAGIGVDNVDVEAATKRGIIVANAPESNAIAAAEHTFALMLAQVRSVPQANASLHAGRWERQRFGGMELYEKTLGVLGFGRIGQLVAERAQAFGMTVVAYDPYVSAERFREFGIERAEAPGNLYAAADIITLHLPATAETDGLLDDEAFAQMRDGVRIVNAARGELIDHDALARALDSGKVAGASLDVFPVEPVTDLPLFAYENVIVTPHLGASTAEAQDRAGVITARQVVAALSGGLVTNAVNIPTIRGEDLDVLAPFLPLCRALGCLAVALAGQQSIDRIEVEYRGHLADRDTRLLGVSVLQGAFEGRIDKEVNVVNAPTIAEDRGIRFSELKESSSEDFTNLVRVRVVSDGAGVGVDGTIFGPRHRPHLVHAWGQDFNIELEPYLAIFRYEDRPGMIGAVGTVCGKHAINIASTAVGRTPGDEHGERGEGAPGGLAVMVITADSEVPQAVLAEILALDGFQDGRAVSL